jgi:hypothetical protein
MFPERSSSCTVAQHAEALNEFKDEGAQLPEIEVVVTSTVADPGSKGWMDTATVTVTDVSVLQTALATLGGVLPELPAPTAAGWEINEVELKAEITAEGGLKILGTGASASATGGVTIRLRRR